MEFARVQRVDTRNYKRIIAVSDVHGNGHLLEKLLKELAFSEDDALFLLGDYIEKGRDSLSAVRLAMALCARGNAFALQGNCDTLRDDLALGRYNADINTYIDWRRDSLLADMCREMGLEREKLGAAKVVEALDARYGEIFAWLRALPHIIETPGAIFVHAGVDAGSLERQSAERCLKREAFLEEGLRFDKPVVCGHMPTSNYFHLTGGRLSFLPISVDEKNIIGIDGGNAVKASGQLNAFVFDGARRYFLFADDLPEAVVREEQEGSDSVSSVAWNHREVELIEQRETSALCRVLFTGKPLEIPNDMLFREGGKLSSYDYTDFRPRLRPGDRVKVLKRGGEMTLVKHQGVVGWAKSGILT